MQQVCHAPYRQIIPEVCYIAVLSANDLWILAIVINITFIIIINIAQLINLKV